MSNLFYSLCFGTTRHELIEGKSTSPGSNLLAIVFEHNRLQMRQGSRTPEENNAIAVLRKSLSNAGATAESRTWRRIELVLKGTVTRHGMSEEVLVLDVSAGGFRVAGAGAPEIGTFVTIEIRSQGAIYGFVCEVAWFDCKKLQYGLAIGGRFADQRLSPAAA